MTDVPLKKPAAKTIRPTSTKPKPASPAASSPSNQTPPAPQRPPSVPSRQAPQANPAWNQWDDWGTDPYGGAPAGGAYGPAYGGADAFGGGYPQAPTAGQPQKRMTPQERTQMIERVYEDILGRKPDTRDINYYKYSTLNEEQVRSQLISSAEHRDLVKQGSEYKKLKDQSEQLQTKNKMLETQIKDQYEEFKQLNLLLQEKNQFIQKLRDGQAEIYRASVKNTVPQCIQQPIVQTAPVNQPSKTSANKTPEPPPPPPPETSIQQTNTPVATFTDEIPQASKPSTSSNAMGKIRDFISKFR